MVEKTEKAAITSGQILDALGAVMLIGLMCGTFVAAFMLPIKLVMLLFR